MGEPYYRITTAKSELEAILYDQEELTIRMAEQEKINTINRDNEGIPRMSDLGLTHRNPFRTKYTPIIISAAQLMVHSNSTNNKFKIEYGGEWMGRGWQAIDFSVGTIAIGSAGVAGTGIEWAYCKNFLASFIESELFKVSSDTIYEYSGETIFVLQSYLDGIARMPALNMMIRETCFEFTWAPGAAATEGGSASQLALHFPYLPPQSYAVTHPAMTVYMPLTLFGLNSIENAYPIASVYSLDRWVEYHFKHLDHCVNVFMTSAATPAGGLIDPAFSGTTSVTWTAVPAMVETRLMIEFWVIHKSLQRIIAMNPHGILIRQFTKITETIQDKSSVDLAVTKIIETIYLICRHYRNTAATQVVIGGVPQVLALDGGIVPPPRIIHPIDPFFLPMGEKPINRITVTARGQAFFKDLDYDDLTMAFPYMYSNPNCPVTSTYNRVIGMITFGIWFYDRLHTATYNSGFGPNLKIAWATHIFNSADPGVLDLILQTINMVLFYRGGVTVRYT